MKKKGKIIFNFFILIVIFSILFLMYKYGYMYSQQIYNFSENYFGIFSFLILLIVILDILFIFLNNPKKKILYKTRLFFGIIFIISSVTSYVLLYLKYKGILDEFNIINMCLFKYNFGFLMTYFITYIYNNFNLNYVYAVCGVLIFISLFFLTGKEIIAFIKYIIKCNNKRKALKMKKVLLKQIEAQIEVKEKLITDSIDDYEKHNLYVDQTIREKVEKAIENDTLPVKISIEEYESNNSDKDKKEKNNDDLGKEKD